jgi:hypothetical protein
VRGDDVIVLGCDHDAAASAAETTGCLVPFQLGEDPISDKVLRSSRRRQPTHGSGHCGGIEF